MIENRKTYIMQRVQRAVATNTVSRFAVRTFKTKQQAERFLKQCAAAYESEISPSSKSKRRKSGLATTTTYAYEYAAVGSENRYWVILLVSDGMGLVEREELANIKGSRIEMDYYELVHDGASWSWQMSSSTVKYWEDRIRRVCAAKPSSRNATVAQSLVSSIQKAPKFRIVRKQIGNLFSLYRQEWRRLRPQNDPMPSFPTFLPYVRQLPKDATKTQTTPEKNTSKTQEAAMKQLFLGKHG